MKRIIFSVFLYVLANQAFEGVLAVVLAIGMSWSHIRRQLSGQVDTDEIEG